MPALAPRLETTPITKNRQGGNGMIGYDAVAKSAVDGSTWLLITLTHVINQSLFAKQWPPMSSAFTSVAMMSSPPLVVAVDADKPIHKMRELARPRRPDLL